MRLLMCHAVFSMLLVALVAAATLIITGTCKQYADFTAEKNWKPETASVVSVKEHKTRSGWVTEVLMRTKGGKLALSSSAPMESDQADAFKARLESTGKLVVFRSTFEPAQYEISYFSEGNRRFGPLLLLEFGVSAILGVSLVSCWLNWRRVIVSAAGLRDSKLASKTLAGQHAKA